MRSASEQGCRRRKMQFLVLYDNSSLSPAIRCGWGFACLVDKRILFDTGDKYEPLCENLAQLKINPKKLSEEDNMIAVFPGTYSEQGNTPLQEMELTDIIGEEEMTFAEAVKKVQKKITTLEDVKDIFTTHTNNMNVETRIPYLMRLMELQDRAKTKDYKVGESYDVTPEEAQALKEQGYELESE